MGVGEIFLGLVRKPGTIKRKEIFINGKLKTNGNPLPNLKEL
jgi:hypothetical protein